MLGVHEEPGKPLTQTLCAHVKDRKLLLILDNCEHLVSACASLANALLRGAPDVRIIATSREALHIPGEQTYPVLPLAVPDRKAGVEALLRSDAVQLFVERARLQKPELHADRARRAGRRRALRAPRRHSARAGARGRADALAVDRRDQRAAARSLQAADRRQSRRARAPADAARAGELVVRPAAGTRADAARPAERIRRRIRPRGGGGRLRRGAARVRGRPRSADARWSTSRWSWSTRATASSRYGLLETIREFAREHLTKRYDMSEQRCCERQSS